MRRRWSRRNSSVAGSALGYLGVKAVSQMPMASIFIASDLPPFVLALGVILGLALSVIGGLYPAIRAAGLEPTEALRHD